MEKDRSDRTFISDAVHVVSDVQFVFGVFVLF